MKPATAPTTDLGYVRLKIAYVALERFREAMDIKYQRHPSSADTDRLDAAELIELRRLAYQRMAATSVTDERTIDRVIAEGTSFEPASAVDYTEYNREPEINPDR